MLMDKNKTGDNHNMSKTLIILERSNGWYGGYEKRNKTCEQVFNTNCNLLFHLIKSYTDQGYKIVCIDKSHENEFMKDRPVLKDILSN